MTLTRIPCPKCRQVGRDRSGDNLAIYADGHKYCYSCGYFETADLRKRIEKPNVINHTTEWPADFDMHIPVIPLKWLSKYGITNTDVLRHRIGWSENRKLLIFPIFDEGRHLIAWQGRNFNIKKRTITFNENVSHSQKEKGYIVELDGPKYLTSGKISDTLFVVEPATATIDLSSTLIFVEGFVDAICVGRTVAASPLFGSYMPLGLLQKAYKRFSRVGIWLDPDKSVEAVRMAIRASQLMPSFVVISEKDPKEYDNPSVTRFVTESQANRIPDPQTEKV